jgi:hypothetical protein
MTTFETAPALPHGYDNENSRYFVPPLFRDYYAKVKHTRISQHVQNRTQKLILEDARKKGAELYPDPKQALEQFRYIQATVEELKGTKWGEYSNLAQHYLTLEEAQTEERRARAHELNKQLSIEANRCPVCKESGEAGQGQTKERVLCSGDKPAYKEIDPLIRSCFPCWVTASDQYRVKVEATKHGKKTRKELAENAIANL